MSDAIRASGAGVLSAWSRTPWFQTTAPEPQTSTIERPRLVELIAGAVERHPLVVVGAPSGFGKSTTLAEWARATDLPVAWLSLTHLDGDSSRITSGILAALRRAARIAPELAGLGELDVDPLDATQALAAIAQTLDGPGGRLALVIDQAEWADELRSSLVGALVTASPPRLRVIVSSTAAPADTLRALGSPPSAVAVGTQELAFDADEIARAAERLEVGLDEPARAALALRTAGWPIAVRIDLLSRHAGAARDLADFVDDAILAKLPDSLADFVRAGVTLQYVDASLGAAVSGDPDAGALLEDCVRRGLFLDRHTRDSSHRVYAWHAAFRNAVLVSERHREPAAVRARHTAAAEALARANPLEAVEQHLLADDPSAAYRLIADRWLELLADGHAQAFDRICATLPAEFAERAAILSARACSAWMARDREGADRLIARARAAEQNGTQPAEDSAATTLAGMTVTDDPGELRRLVALTRDLVRDPSRVPARMAPFALFLAGYTELRLREDTSTSISTLRSALREAEAQGLPRLASRIAATLSFVCAFGGHFAESLGYARASRATAPADDEWRVYDGGAARTAEGFVAYWCDDLDAAREAFADVLMAGYGSGGYEPVALMYDALAAAASPSAQWRSEARSRLQQMPEQLILGVPWRGFRACALAELALAGGELDRAVHFARVSLSYPDLPVPRAMAAETLRRAGDARGALEVIARTDASRLTIPARVRLLLTDALLHRAEGRQQRAHVVLERSLDLAAPERISRPYSDPLPELVRLLTEHATWGTAHDAFVAERLVQQSVAASAAADHRLSAREAEILAYLRTSLTIAEIAESLFVSVNTVKTHVRAVYRKLGVQNRRDAVRRRL